MPILNAACSHEFRHCQRLSLMLAFSRRRGQLIAQRKAAKAAAKAGA